VSARFDVDPRSLDDTALRLAAATRAIDDLRRHPGVLRGRAADTGDSELAAAVVHLASAWGWGLETLGAEARRWSALLQSVASTYRQADRLDR
jgi:hypothetical protein